MGLFKTVAIFGDGDHTVEYHDTIKAARRAAANDCDLDGAEYSFVYDAATDAELDQYFRA